MVVAWVRKAVVGSGHGWCAARLPSLPPTVQQAVTQDGGCWLKAGSPRSHTRTHNHPHLHQVSRFILRDSDLRSERLNQENLQLVRADAPVHQLCVASSKLRFLSVLNQFIAIIISKILINDCCSDKH